MKQTLNIAILLSIFSIAFVACSKQAIVASGNTDKNFYHGNILGSPNSIIGPGNAILLRGNGTMREYANDYYSLGTSMTAKDTANAKIKIDGTYILSYNGDVNTITATWYQPNGSPALTYTLVGTIKGTTMTGTFSSAGTGIGSSSQFTFTSNP